MKDWEPQPKSKKLLNENALEALALLKWISRCPSINGPLGMTAHIIKPEKLEDARKLVARVEGR